MSGSGVDVDQTDKWISRMQENDYKCLPDSVWLEMNTENFPFILFILSILGNAVACCLILQQ